MGISHNTIKKITRPHVLALLGVLIVSSLLLFYKLGEPHLSHWDEAWYADISRNMAQTGNIQTPTWNKEPFFEKPPLYHWFSALAYRTLPDEELAARFFSAVAGVVTILVVYWFVYQDTKRVDVAAVSALVLVSTIGFIYRARTGNLDVFQTLWIVLSLLSFIKALSRDSKHYYLFSGMFSSLAFLTKGLSGFIVLFVSLIALFVNKNADVKSIGKMFIVSITIISLWIGWYYLANGEQFINQFFIHQIDKLYGRSGSLFDNFSLGFIRSLYQGMKYMFVLFIPAYLYSVIKWKERRFQLLTITIALYIVAYSFVESKNNWLLVPIYPMIAMVIGFFYHQMTVKRKSLQLPIFMIVVIVSAIQLIQFRDEYIVADVVAADAQIATLAQKYTGPDEILYLTHYYYPSTVYYSNRKTLAVYSDHSRVVSWWIRPRLEWDDILSRDRVTVIATVEDALMMSSQFEKYELVEIEKVADKILFQKNHERP